MIPPPIISIRPYDENYGHRVYMPVCCGHSIYGQDLPWIPETQVQQEEKEEESRAYLLTWILPVVLEEQNNWESIETLLRFCWDPIVIQVLFR